MDLGDITRAIDGALAGVAVAPVTSPWLAWSTVVLMRHRARQAWHRRVVTALADHEHDADQGPVPGLPGWQFEFHGRGCCLVGPDGEQIDVDHHDEGAAIVDPWFFAARIESIRDRDLPERRLWRWLPHRGALIAALADLRAAGILDYPDGDHLFELCPALAARVAVVTSVDFTNPDIAARWLVALGDGDAAIPAHHRWLIDRSKSHGRDLLPAAAELLPTADLHALCAALVAGPIGAVTGRAVEVLHSHVGAPAGPLVRSLLARITAADPPYTAYQCLAFALAHDPDAPDLRARFSELAAIEVAAGFLGNPYLGRYALLALRHLPDLAMPLVRRALRSTTPVAVSDLASMLAAIDQPWCHRELAAALRERPTQTYLAEALQRSSSSALAAAYTPPRHDPSRPGFSDEEVVHSSIAALFPDLDADERRLALELRAAHPAEWPG